MMSMVKLDRHAFKSIRQQDFDNVLREFNRDPRCAKVYSIIDDKEIGNYIKIEEGKLIFDYVIFKNITIDIILYDVVFTNCLFYDCNFKTIMEDCNMINTSLKKCSFDKWIIKRGDFKNLDFIACELALDSEDEIISKTFKNIRFCRCNGYINIITTCDNIQFEQSNMCIKSSHNINGMTIERSKMYFALCGSLYGKIRFSYSEIELSGFEDKKFYISKDTFVDSSKVNIDTFGMEDINCDDIMKIKSLNSNITGSKTGYLFEPINIDMLTNNIIQTGNIGSRHTRTYYDAANDLVHCGCWENNGSTWDGDDCSGGSLEQFIMRIDEVYPESSDNLRHKKYRKEYMSAINLFKSKKKSYAKKKEEYIKILEECKMNKRKEYERSIEVVEERRRKEYDDKNKKLCKKLCKKEK